MLCDVSVSVTSASDVSLVCNVSVGVVWCGLVCGGVLIKGASATANRQLCLGASCSYSQMTACV